MERAKVDLLAMISPALVILTVLALVVKESPFYIDLSATAFLGWVICFRFREVGLVVATALLAGVLGYNFLTEDIPAWELWLGSSLELSFIVAVLTSKESFEAFQEACRSVSKNALDEIEDWKLKIEEAVSRKEAVVSELKGLQEKLLSLQDSLKVQTEQGEMFERLLERARNEVVQVTREKEDLALNYIKEKQRALKFEEAVSAGNEEIDVFSRLNLQLEFDLKEMQKFAAGKEQALHQKTLEVLDREWKIERLEDQMKSAAGDQEGKLQSLGEQLEALIDRLKNLQAEKDDLEKALEEALKPADGVVDSRELKRVSGLYHQLRSQFSEKSKALDETRAELFKVQEAFLLLQKKVEEEYIFDQNQAFSAYEAHISELEAQIAELMLD